MHTGTQEDHYSSLQKSFIYNSWPRPGKPLCWAAVELHLRALQYAAGEGGHRQGGARQFLTDKQSSGSLLLADIFSLGCIEYLRDRRK